MCPSFLAQLVKLVLFLLGADKVMLQWSSKADMGPQTGQHVLFFGAKFVHWKSAFFKNFPGEQFLGPPRNVTRPAILQPWHLCLTVLTPLVSEDGHLSSLFLSAPNGKYVLLNSLNLTPYFLLNKLGEISNLSWNECWRCSISSFNFPNKI